MTIFRYRARSKDGRFIVGTLEAQSQTAAGDQLRSDGFFPIAIEEDLGKGPRRRGLFSRGFHRGELVFLTRQLSNLLDSGIPLARALELLVNHAKDIKVRGILIKVRDEVTGGAPFWEALSRYPEIFSRLYVSTIRAGEKGAGLEKVVRRLADYMEQMKEMRQTLGSMLVYPLILLFVGLGTIVFLMTFVIPKISFMFLDLGSELPWITRVMIALSVFFSRYAWILFVVSIAGFFILTKTLGTNKAKMRLEIFFFRLPLVGDLMQKLLFSRLTGILGLLLSNGVSILESLQVARGIVENKTVANSLQEVSQNVSQGASLHESLLHAEAFAPEMVDMIAVGEETGRLDETLLKISDLYEREAKDQIKRLLTILEPALIFVLALGVGFLVMAMLLPIMQMNLEQL